MKRPYVFCHMLTSVDGKIMGKYMDTPQGEKAGDIFYDIAFGKKPYYQHQGWLSGRITTDDNFTHYKNPVLDDNAEEVPQGDHIADKNFGMYYVSIDPAGKLGWDKNTVTYVDTTAHIIEVLTEKAGNSYKAFLRNLGISYIIAGKDVLDLEMALEKLKDHFSIKTLMLGGGGVLNWSFIQAGFCNELSMVVAPAADGSSETPALFETRDRSEDIPIGFELRGAQVMDAGVLWLRYSVNNSSDIS
ncbi:MAG: RibD family protein [Bacillota bacterium]|nr:RibD family protein [Bacillota bacterium]